MTAQGWITEVAIANEAVGTAEQASCYRREALSLLFEDNLYASFYQYNEV